MPNILSLLFSFSGRINRAPFWLGVVITIVAMFGCEYLINPAQFTSLTDAPMSKASAMLGLVMLVPTMAITVKRCNDRDWPVVVPIAFGLLMLPYFIAPLLGWNYSQNFNVKSLAGALNVATLAISFAFLIDNGFLRGTVGPNRHGPDPLGGTT